MWAIGVGAVVAVFCAAAWSVSHVLITLAAVVRQDLHNLRESLERAACGEFESTDPQAAGRSPEAWKPLPGNTDRVAADDGAAGQELTLEGSASGEPWSSGNHALVHAKRKKPNTPPVRADRENRIHPRREAGTDDHLVPDDGTESWQVENDGVRARRQIRDAVLALAVGHLDSRGAGSAGDRGRDGRSRQGLAVRVEHLSEDGGLQGSLP